MLSFMFAVLGSVLFWVGYAIVSLFAGTLLWKKEFPYSFENLKNGKYLFDSDRDISDMDISALFFPLVLYLIWPFIIVLYFLKFSMKLVVLFMRKVILAVDKVTPNIQITKKDN